MAQERYPQGKTGLFVFGQVSKFKGEFLQDLAEIVLDSALVQTISHTANSLWSSSVVLSAQGSASYIVSSAQDGKIRFFTTVPELMAPESVREIWNQEVSSRQLDK